MHVKEERIELFKKKYKICPDTGCWNWTASIKLNGYGVFYSEVGTYAHRFSYQYFKGDLVKGLEIDHLCSNPACVNPDHLEQVTGIENLHRGRSFDSHPNKGAFWRDKTHCKFGHEFNDKNTYAWKSGRYCRVCRAERSKELRYTKKLNQSIVVPQCM